ncbi:hypothetical protein C8R47DRAFT_1081609 [Mycena vitilis]|nr:hypothetical protein C8R47DRAFT_1081609 [Mycena vitilis]
MLQAFTRLTNRGFDTGGRRALQARKHRALLVEAYMHGVGFVWMRGDAFNMDKILGEDARGCNRPLRIRNFVARRRLGGRLDLAGEIRWCGDRLGVRACRWSQLGDCGGMWNVERLGADIRRETREGVTDRCESEISWRGGDWVDGWTWRAKSGGAVTDWACGLAAGVS